MACTEGLLNLGVGVSEKTVQQKARAQLGKGLQTGDLAQAFAKVEPEPMTDAAIRKKLKGDLANSLHDGKLATALGTCSPSPPQSTVAGKADAERDSDPKELTSVFPFKRKLCFDKTVTQLGCCIDWDARTPIVVSVIPDGQGHKQGLLVGDSITFINGARTIGETRKDLLLKLQERPLVLELVRNDQLGGADGEITCGSVFSMLQALLGGTKRIQQDKETKAESGSQEANCEAEEFAEFTQEEKAEEDEVNKRLEEEANRRFAARRLASEIEAKGLAEEEARRKAVREARQKTAAAAEEARKARQKATAAAEEAKRNAFKNKSEARRKVAEDTEKQVANARKRAHKESQQKVENQTKQKETIAQHPSTPEKKSLKLNLDKVQKDMTPHKDLSSSQKVLASSQTVAHSVTMPLTPLVTPRSVTMPLTPHLTPRSVTTSLTQPSRRAISQDPLTRSASFLQDQLTPLLTPRKAHLSKQLSEASLMTPPTTLPRTTSDSTLVPRSPLLHSSSVRCVSPSGSFVPPVVSSAVRHGASSPQSGSFVPSTVSGSFVLPVQRLASSAIRTSSPHSVSFVPPVVSSAVRALSPHSGSFVPPVVSSAVRASSPPGSFVPPVICSSLPPAQLTRSSSATLHTQSCSLLPSYFSSPRQAIATSHAPMQPRSPVMVSRRLSRG